MFSGVVPKEEEVSLVVDSGHLSVVAHRLVVEQTLKAPLDSPAQAGSKIVQDDLRVVVLQRPAVAENLLREAKRRQLEVERWASR